jgi:Acyl-CoA reductase (LuxC)
VSDTGARGAGETGAPGVAAADAAALRRDLARLREAGRGLRSRPAAERLEALGVALERFRDPASTPRRTLASGLPMSAGFTRAVVERGLSLALEDFTAAALRALYTRELGAPDAAGGGAARAAARFATGFPSTAVLLAGAIPSASLVSLVAPLALGSPVLARAAARDPWTAPLLADVLAGVDPGLRAAFAVARFDPREDDALDAFLGADCIVATGSDATVARVGARVAPPRRLVAYGHRASFAAFGPDASTGAPLDAACRALALDVALWDQLGCLSPVSLLVAGDARVARAAAEALAAALAALEPELPRGEVGPAAAAQAAHECAEAELRAAARGDVALLAGAAATVVAEADARLARPAPLHRFVRVHPVIDAAGVCAALEPFGPQLAAVGLAGFGAAGPGLARALAALGASRVCPLGRMQAPPLDWCHDNQGVLLPLARLADAEAGL